MVIVCDYVKEEEILEEKGVNDEPGPVFKLQYRSMVMVTLVIMRKGKIFQRKRMSKMKIMKITT